MRRYLDRYEVAHLGAPTAFVADCVGAVNESALAAAFDLLCVQHPALRAHVRHDGHGHFLDARHGHRAVFRAQSGEQSGYPRDVAARWDVADSLATLTVSRLPDRVRVAFYLDHCIGDGRCAYALYESLWRLYTDIVTGAKVSVRPPHKLPPPPLEVLAVRTGTRRDAPTGVPPVSAALPVLRYRRVLLTGAETTALLKTARAHGVTVYALLAAAAAHAQGATTIWAVIDLRGRVEPPVGPTDTTNFASAATLDLALGEDPIATAGDIRARLLAAIAAGVPLRNMRDDAVGRSMSRPRSGLAAAIVSNLGSMPEFATPHGVAITDFRIWPYGWAHVCPMYMASTYGGRLGVDMVFRADVHTDETADRLADAVRLFMTAV